MSGIKKAFIDTNIWIYQIDKNDSAKRKIIDSFLEEISETHRVVISTQVINEFFTCAVKKLNIDPRDAKRLLDGLWECEVVAVDKPHIDRAIDICTLQRISYWDALMLSAAESVACAIFVSEDLNSGQKLGEMEIINPFKQEGRVGKNLKPRKRKSN